MPTLSSEAVATFRVVAEESLSALELALDALAAGNRDPEHERAIFHAARTLKGAALVVGRQSVDEFAHVLEKLFVLRRDARVSPGEADRLLLVLGELVLAHGRLASALSRLTDSERDALAEVESTVPPPPAEPYERVRTFSLVPMGVLAARLRRTTHWAARAFGKSVEFGCEGTDHTFDTTIVEGLREPLMQLLRNAVEHGIETPAQRVAAGKPEVGTITLRFLKAGNMAVVELSDDGRGVDRERIAASARERGRNVQAHELSEADLLSFIFEPGFSAASAKTARAEYGVGRGVVHQNIQALRGSVQLHSRVGQGTTFTITLPLDVTIVDCLLVESAAQSFVLPQERVLEVIERATPARAAFSMIRVREETMPCIRLAALFGSSDAPERETVLILSHAGGRVGLAVERSHGVQQTVVRPVGPQFHALALIAGAAVLGSGDVALLLDVDQLALSSTRHARA